MSVPIRLLTLYRRSRFRLWLGLAVTLTGAGPLLAKDAFVLLSGGGTPLINNYSQYLQARALAEHLRKIAPPEAVWVFFGAGNRSGETPLLADVYRRVVVDGVLRDTWEPGALPDNRPAYKANFLRALREEVLPTVSDGGTLYLFVGDHGSLAKQEPQESVITLWQLKQMERGWNTDPNEELSVTDLRDVLADGLGAGRVVFSMTQCHSGGFHFLGVPRRVWANPDWLTEPVPGLVAATSMLPLPAVAGFTATDEASLAAGCDPDPNPERWSGYERYVPEALLGFDLFDPTMQGPAMPSFAAAHLAATLVDQTIDKPRSSAEQFLAQWAELIEQLADASQVRPEIRRHVAAYQQAVDTGLADAAHPALQARRAQYVQFIDRMVEQNPRVADLLQHGSKADLVQAIAPGGRPEGRPHGAGPTAGPDARTTAWRDVVRPAWQAAIAAGEVPDLNAPTLRFERYLLAQEDRGRDVMFPRDRSRALLNDIYWQSSYAFPARFDAAQAEAVTRWVYERPAYVAKWAQAASDAAVRAAGELIAPPPVGPGMMYPPPRTLSRPIAAERTLLYRRVVAAWAFLWATQETAALDQLHDLLRLENTSLPGTAVPAALAG